MDFAKQAARDLYNNTPLKDTLNQFKNNVEDEVNLSDTAENLALGAADAGYQGANYARGNKASLGYSFKAGGGTCSVNGWVQKNTKGSDPNWGVNVQYSHPWPSFKHF